MMPCRITDELVANPYDGYKPEKIADAFWESLRGEETIEPYKKTTKKEIIEMNENKTTTENKKPNYEFMWLKICHHLYNWHKNVDQIYTAKDVVDDILYKINEIEAKEGVRF